MLKDKHRAVHEIVCVLHPYGKELNLHPHAHVLLTEGGLTKSGEWVPVSFLEYGALWRIWQYQLLTMVKRVLPCSLESNRLIDCLFSEHKEGFYVYAKRWVSKPRYIAGYICRYFRYPAVVEFCVSDFDVETDMVTFWFVGENKVKRFVSLRVFEFVNRLVDFIADKNLGLFCCYGLYFRCTVGRLLEGVCVS